MVRLIDISPLVSERICVGFEQPEYICVSHSFEKWVCILFTITVHCFHQCQSICVCFCLCFRQSVSEPFCIAQSQ